jgi:thiol:disulfide interchange protein DsbA
MSMQAGNIAASLVLIALAVSGRAGSEPVQPTGADQARIQLAQASRWKEGTHYTVIKPAEATKVAAGKIEVMEMFWYGCPHCYELEPYLQAWEKKKAANVEFVRIPATFGPWHQMHARLYYTLMAMNHPELHIVAFREAHFSETLLLGPDIPSTEDIHIGFARRHGIDPDKFKTAYNSKEVIDKVKQADELVRRYKLDAVPKIIINGKYMADVASAGGQSQLISLINDLAAKEAQVKR